MSRNVSQLFDSIVKHGGGSYNFETNTLNPTTGYMVAVEGKSKYYDAPANMEAFRDCVIDYAKTFFSDVFTSEKENYLGAWINPDNGRLCMDISERIEDEITAVRLGRERAQIAIFDNAAKKVINVKFAYVMAICNPHHVQQVITI